MSLFESVVDRVRKNLSARCQVEPGTAVFVACSGGADSVALAYALSKASPDCKLVGVGFIDHGLRDVSLERKAAQACALRLSVEFTERRVDLPQAGNVQQEARDARYAALESMAPEGACIATGHTLTDQAETVLQRLIRGTGMRGLQGIHHRRGRWIRPLLDVSREETRALGFDFVDDPTNVTSKYSRNRLREQVLPLLLKENPRAEAAIATTANQAQAELELVDIIVSLLGDDLELSGLPTAWVHTITRWKYQDKYPELPPPRTRAISNLIDHLQAGEASRTFSIGHGLRAKADAGRLSFSTDDDSRRSVVLHGPGAYGLKNEVIKVHEGGYKPQVDEIESASVVFYDAADIVWPLTIRPLQSSDYIVPIGSDTELSARDAIRASGFSWNSKRRKNVLIDGLGRVLWVGGMGRTSIAAPTEHTVRCVVVTFPNASDLLI